jgi:hypothetical protein
LDDDNGTLDELARAMYASHYFSGYHDPHSIVTYNGQSMSGAEANIESYRDALLRIQPGIIATLTNWTPVTADYDLSTVRGLQEALTYLAGKFGRTDLDPKGVDGDFGPNTKAAVEALQTYAGIGVDGDAGTETKNAILRLISGASSATLPSPPPAG